jgi:hypothetical protein
MAAESTSEVRVRDPLSEVTRKERRYLLGISTLGFIMVKTGLIPAKITTFGIEFSETDQRSLLFIIGLVTLYFLISFVAYAGSDFVAWRIAINSTRLRLLGEIAEDRERIYPHEDSHKLQDRLFFLGQLSHPISWGRALLEFLFPFLFGLYMTILLLIGSK